MPTSDASTFRLHLDARGELGRDVPCLRCGESLRKLQPKGNCPNCGLPLSESLRLELLRFGGKRWLRGAIRGAACLVGGLGGAIVAGALEILLWPTLLPDALSVRGMLLGAPELAALYGAWMIAAPEPERVALSQGMGVRSAARIAMTVGGAVAILQSVTHVMGTTGSPHWLTLVAFVVYTLGLAGLMFHLQLLCRRTASPALGWHASTLAWGLIGVATLAVVGKIADPLIDKALGESLDRGEMGTVMIAAMFGWFVMTCWSMFFLLRLRRALLGELAILKRIRASAFAAGINANILGRDDDGIEPEPAAAAPAQVASSTGNEPPGDAPPRDDKPPANPD